MEHSSRGIDPQSRQAGHELNDVNPGAITRFVTFLMIATAMMLVAGWFIFTTLSDVEKKASAPASPLIDPKEVRLPPEPRLQSTPIPDLKAVREADAAVLHSYGWVDEKEKIAHIPIERALELIAERGLPAKNKPAPAKGAAKAAPAAVAPGNGQ